MVDINRIFKETINNGIVKFGTKQTKSVIDTGKAKIIVMSKNCIKSPDIEKLANNKKIPIYYYESNSVDLGSICGKAFAVSVFAVLDDGGSNILKIIKDGKSNE